MPWPLAILALMLLFVAGCVAVPVYSNSPYQVQANALVDQYNTAHGTQVPYPMVRVGTLPNLEEGHCYTVPGYTSWITIAEAWNLQRHPAGYSMSNTLPHEVAHHICFMLGLSPPGQVHGAAWQAVALELGVPPDDGFFHDANLQATSG